MIDFKQTKAGDIIVRIPRAAIRHTVKNMEDLPGGTRVTNTKLFSDGVLAELMAEQEDGTTLAHEMLDRAILNAFEEGREGLKVGDEEF